MVINPNFHHQYFTLRVNIMPNFVAHLQYVLKTIASCKSELSIQQQQYRETRFSPSQTNVCYAVRDYMMHYTKIIIVRAAIYMIMLKSMQVTSPPKHYDAHIIHSRADSPCLPAL